MSLLQARNIRGFNGIRTHGLYVSASTEFYQLSYEDPSIWEQPKILSINPRKE